MDRNTVSVLGVNVDRCSMQEAFKRAIHFLSEDSPHAIYTPNPEIINNAYKDKEFAEILNSGDMVIPDGIGVVIASKILKKPVKERVPGYDLTCNLLDYAAKNNIKVFLFGGKEGVADTAAKKLSQKGVNIVGTLHGYQKDNEKVAETIKKSGAELVLVCLGAPKQEQWINDNKEQAGAKLYIGAGGSLDVIAGEVKRAPDIFIKLNLEWFYRLAKQPSRIIRIMQLPLFMLRVIFLKGGKKQ